MRAVVVVAVVAMAADAATKPDRPQRNTLSGPERVVQAPSGPLVCSGSAVHPSNRMPRDTGGQGGAC